MPSVPNPYPPCQGRFGRPLSRQLSVFQWGGRLARLDLAHKKLDAAVAAAYGWPADLTDEQILKRLLKLNLKRAGDWLSRHFGSFSAILPSKTPMFTGLRQKSFQSTLTGFQAIGDDWRMRKDCEGARGMEGLFSSLRSVGSAQSPELCPSGVGTTRRRLLRKYGVQRLALLGSGATLAPRLPNLPKLTYVILEVEVELTRELWAELQRRQRQQAEWRARRSRPTNRYREGRKMRFLKTNPLFGDVGMTATGSAIAIQALWMKAPVVMIGQKFGGRPRL